MTENTNTHRKVTQGLRSFWSEVKAGYQTASPNPIATALGRVLAIIVISFIVAVPAQYAWNTFTQVNQRFGRITYMEMWGLILVVEILFTRFTANND